MYTLFCGGWERQSSSWWELIDDIKQGRYDERYGHNPNDHITSILPIFYGEDSQGIPIYRYDIRKEQRDCIAYHDDLVINLAEIRKGLKEYRSHDRKYNPRRWTRDYFEYRREPVPGLRHHRHHHRYWKIPQHSYRSSWVKALEFGEYPKAKDHLTFDPWWDDEYPRRPEKNWKSQGKKRHQWEKK